MDESIVKFVLRGKTDLLMHADSVEFADDLEKIRAEAGKELSKKGDDRSPAWSWLGCLYHDGKYIAMPSANLATCLRQAGATIQIPGAKGKTLKEASQSGLVIMAEHLTFNIKHKQIPIEPIMALQELGDSREVFPQHQSAVSKLGFKLFVKRAAIGQSKHVRVRPRFSAWEVCGEIQIVNPEVLNTQMIRALFTAAGKKGLGDWRPGCKTPGPYGQFDALLSIPGEKE